MNKRNMSENLFTMPINVGVAVTEMTVTPVTLASTEILPTQSVLRNGSRMLHLPLVWPPEVVFRVTTILVVMLLTLIGNSTLILCIVCHKKLRHKRVNIFLVNLAIGDLMVCVVTMTTEILFVAFGEWVLGNAACKLIVYSQIVTLASATFLITAMSIDRYQVIVQPFKSLTGQPKIWSKVLTAWALALVFAIPQLFIFVQTDEGVHPDGHTVHMCKSKGYTASWQRKLYFTLMMVYVLIVPTVIMSFCYINIIKVVWMRTSSQETRPPKLRFVSSLKSRASGEHNHAVASNRASQSGSMDGNSLNIPPRMVSNSKRNVIKMTLSVITAFVLCWTPYFVVSLVRIYSNYKIRLHHALSVTEIMALVHSALNPILYGIFNTHMARRACSELCVRCCSKDAIVARELNVSESDSSYWTETKLHQITMGRLSMGQAIVTYGQGNKRRQPSRYQRIKSFLCCEPIGYHCKPLLVYRRGTTDNTRRNTQPAQHEAFQMLPRSTGETTIAPQNNGCNINSSHSHNHSYGCHEHDIHHRTSDSSCSRHTRSTSDSDLPHTSYNVCNRHSSCVDCRRHVPITQLGGENFTIEITVDTNAAVTDSD